MEKVFFALLVSLIFLSGCIYPGEVSKKIDPLLISFSSDLKEVKSGEMTFFYLTFDNLDEKEEYKVDAKIMNAGLFNIIDTPKSGELHGFQRKMLKWTLEAHNVPADTQTIVSAEARISKTHSFHFPVLFVNPEYRRQEKISNRPIPKGSKTHSFSDNLVHVNIELNKAPPIDSGTVYGNVEIVPARSGIVDSVSISVDGSSCEMNEHQNAGFCTFSYNPRTIEEKRFEMKVDYKYKETGSVGFTILQKVAE